MENKAKRLNQIGFRGEIIAWVALIASVLAWIYEAKEVSGIFSMAAFAAAVTSLVCYFKVAKITA